MTNKQLNKKEWDLTTNELFKTYDKMGIEEDFLNEIVDECTEFDYFNDCIGELTDNFIPIYNNELWELAPKISEYIEESIEEFGTPKEIDLIRIFQMGVYYYLKEVAYHNETIIKQNVMIEYLNNQNYVSKLRQVDIDYFMDKMVEFEDDNIKDYIEDIVEDYIQYMKNESTLFDE